MEEYIDIVDKDNNDLNFARTRNEAHAKGLWHRAAGGLIVNLNNEILLQQRSLQKEKNPGLWDLSASGHIPSKETPWQAFLREAEEEIGVEIDKNNSNFLGVYKRQELHNGGRFIENQFDYIYIIKQDVDIKKIKMQKEEVQDVKFVSIEEFKRLQKSDKLVKRAFVWDDALNFLENALNK